MDDDGIVASITDEAPGALIAVSGTGEVTYWNRAAEETFGYTGEEANGRRLSELIFLPGTVEHDAELQERDVPSYESTRRRKDGSLIYVNVSVRLHRAASGELRGRIYSKVDVTHLRVRQDARTIESRYHDLLESTPDAIVIVNDIGRILQVNGQAEAMFGYARQELVGEALEVLLPKRYRAAHVGHRAGYFTQSRMRPMGVGLEL